MLDHLLLTQKIGYNFENPKLLKEALTHSSCLGMKESSGEKSYERLEFLGDAVLTFIITEFLIKNFSEETEGSLTKRRSILINRNTLLKVGIELGILEHLKIVGNVHELSETEASKIIEDTTEALLGAIYLDGGMEHCKKFVAAHWKYFLFKEVIPDDDPKTYLQEWSQKKGFGIPKYTLVSKSGEAHTPVFAIEVEVSNLPIFVGESSSKKSAEKEAAKAMLKYIKTNYDSN